MDMIKEAIVEWLREILVGGIIDNLSGLFDSTNERVAEIAGQVGTTPMAWNSSIYNMVHSLSESVIMPIAGVILAFVMTLELIQLIIDKNNMNEVDTWTIFRWIFKTACAVIIVTNTWSIVMGVFDMAQSVVSSAAGVTLSEASLDISGIVTDLEARLMAMDLGPLFGLWFQTLFVDIVFQGLPDLGAEPPPQIAFAHVQLIGNVLIADLPVEIFIDEPDRSGDLRRHSPAFSGCHFFRQRI